MLPAFVHGYLLAFGLILPLGPQNAFVLTQGATQMRLARALPVSLIAAICDTLLILLAVLGVSVVMLTLPWVRAALVAGGVIFLIVMGWLTWRSAGAAESGGAWEAAASWPLRRQIVFAASVSLLNPHAILDTVGVIGTSAVAYYGDARAAFTLGCILNSWAWFVGLAIVGRLVGSIAGVRRWLSRASAVIMWVSAIYLGVTLLR